MGPLGAGTTNCYELLGEFLIREELSFASST